MKGSSPVACGFGPVLVSGCLQYVFVVLCLCDGVFLVCRRVGGLVVRLVCRAVPRRVGGLVLGEPCVCSVMFFQFLFFFFFEHHTYTAD